MFNENNFWDRKKEGGSLYLKRHVDAKKYIKKGTWPLSWVLFLASSLYFKLFPKYIFQIIGLKENSFYVAQKRSVDRDEGKTKQIRKNWQRKIEKD